MKQNSLYSTDIHLSTNGIFFFLYESVELNFAIPNPPQKFPKSSPTGLNNTRCYPPQNELQKNLFRHFQ